jgi:hypothetical protein
MKKYSVQKSQSGDKRYESWTKELLDHLLVGRAPALMSTGYVHILAFVPVFHLVGIQDVKNRREDYGRILLVGPYKGNSPTSGVVDPWRFGTDPDPRIRTTHGSAGSRFGSTSCFFHQWFFVYYFLKVCLHQSSKIKSHKTVAINVFLTFIRIHTEDYGSRSGRPENIRLRIHTLPTTL